VRRAGASGRTRCVGRDRLSEPAGSARRAIRRGTVRAPDTRGAVGEQAAHSSPTRQPFRRACRLDRPGHHRALGFANRGGTTPGLLFANRSTWAYVVDGCARLGQSVAACPKRSWRQWMAAAIRPSAPLPRGQRESPAGPRADGGTVRRGQIAWAGLKLRRRAVPAPARTQTPAYISTTWWAGNHLVKLGA
jgi:hypothetical protein